MRSRARGFTLLEVLLAFVILAVAMGMLLAMLSRGLGQVRRAQDETEASLHAQSLLDSLGVLEPLEAGQRDGVFEGGRYRYRLEIQEVEDPIPVVPPPPGAPPAPPAPQLLGGPKLLGITLTVAWGEASSRQQLRYATLRARTPPLAGNPQ
jgi:general secretion pathway protein I